MIDWIQGWWQTFLIWAFDRETWHVLTTKHPDFDDYVEVYRPKEEK
jgi:hypothetical protein